MKKPLEWVIGSGMGKSAYDQAQEFYSRHPDKCFAEDLLHYSRVGYTYCSPECIIMAELFTDRWHIYFACGSGAVARFFRICPTYRAMVTFRRPGRGRDKIHYYSFDRLKSYYDKTT